jgi:16S rRNA (cytosine967-C5)-methyltransferase
MQTINERAVAVAILTDITEGGAYANQALRKTLAAYGLPSRASAFVTEVVNETIRNLLLIDNIIAAFSNTPLEIMKPFIRGLLRVSVCQLRLMDKIPASAAINEAVKLVKQRGMVNLSGFVNGVLRSVSREADKPAPPILNENNPAEYIAARYSYPKWLARKLVKELGAEALTAARAMHMPPSVTVYANTRVNTAEALALRLTAEGVTCEPGALYGECLRLTRTPNITGLPAFNDGCFFVMDEGAVAAVKSLELSPGMKVLDMCAAPGGKTFAMACAMQGGGDITAWDLHKHKVGLLNASAALLKFKNIKTEVKDASVPDETLREAFDRVLLDAPCSGFGIIKKKPDIKLNRKPSDIAELAAAQRRLLAAAASYVRKGGVLVYSTCTLTAEENGDNVKWFTGSFPFTPEEERLILPSVNNDGFYYARLRRNSVNIGEAVSK